MFLPSYIIAVFIKLAYSSGFIFFISSHSVNIKQTSAFFNASCGVLTYVISVEYLFLKFSIPTGSYAFMFAPSSINIGMFSKDGASLKSSVPGLNVKPSTATFTPLNDLNFSLAFLVILIADVLNNVMLLYL